MLLTPLGKIAIYFDGNPVEYAQVTAPADPRLYPNVNGAFILKYYYQADEKEHTLRCIVENNKCVAHADTGERLVAVSIYTDTVKMTIGMEDDFGCLREYNKYDFGGLPLQNGLEVHIDRYTKSHDFVFGVAWISPYTQENEVQTWFAADPTISNSKTCGQEL